MSRTWNMRCLTTWDDEETLMGWCAAAERKLYLRLICASWLDAGSCDITAVSYFINRLLFVCLSRTNRLPAAEWGHFWGKNRNRREIHRLLGIEHTRVCQVVEMHSENSAPSIFFFSVHCGKSGDLWDMSNATSNDDNKTTQVIQKHK